jgi:hypothetical protein
VSDRPDTAETGSGPGGPPSEDELRAAYEDELSRISVTDMLAQSAVSLLNMAARRLAPAEGRAATAPDLEQVRDAIDGVRGLLEILDRRIPAEVRPLRDALSQLQMSYAAQVKAAGEGGEPSPGDGGEGPGGGAGGGGAGGSQQGPAPASGDPEGSRPGPAESSGRLWVPGR